MKINRHNYEEYFILYLDNELNAADRKMVESFAALHPDLKDELDILAQFKLTPDTDIVFDTKEELFKSTDSLPVDLQNTLLSYIDGELNTVESRNLESVILNNSAAKAELELLQKTKLEPEEIIFEDKASLYRREKTYVIGVKWWRIAAAAVLLVGLGITTLILINNNNQNPGGEIVNKSTEKNQPAQPGNDVKEQPSNDQLAKDENKEILPQKEVNTTGIAFENKIQPTRSNNHNGNKQPETREKPNDVIAHNEKPSNNLPEATNNPFVVKNNNPEVAVNNQKPSTPNNEPLTNSTVTTQTPQPYIIQTSYSEDDVVDQPDSKKNKLRGFFRKVARTFEKRTNIETTSDDNKLLVAGLSINLK